MIHLKNIYASYKLINYRGDTLRKTLVTRSMKSLILDKEVLSGLTLKVEKGTVFGLVGRNGSGKSTLLRVISEVMPIKSGEIHISGRVSPIIGISAFTDAELTTEENIAFYCKIRGMTKTEKASFTEKVLTFTEFSENELLKPIKTFSHGMISRLNFAIGIFDNNDVFLFDEVLAVGDIELVKKSVKLIRELKNQGKTIILVSHSLSLIESVADLVGVLVNGVINQIDDPQHLIPLYKNMPKTSFDS